MRSPALPPRVLLVEDDEVMAERYAADLAAYAVGAVASGAGALDAVRDQVPDVMVLDVRLPDMNGLDVLRAVREEGLPVGVVVVTSHGSMNMAIEAMQAGANDFLVKPFSGDRLRVTVANVIERQRLSRQVAELSEGMDEERGFFGLIGSSPAMRGVYRTIEAAAPSKATVFITGESGTGKELCAQAVHAASPRASKPFIAINCAAIPRDLMESEIFGHVKGSFTGATATREGAATLADGGTLFLDEVCEMELSLQSKLLRFLQTGTVQKVGGDGPKKVDIRVVCATNRDPQEEVAEGRFREDLFYRLHVIPVHVPPLRERPGDAVEIARVLLDRLSREEGRRFRRFAREAEVAIAAHDWPGNVRQMENVLRQAVVLNDGEELTADMLPLQVGRAVPLAAEAAAGPGTPGQTAVTEARPNLKPLWLIEKEAIERAIALCGGNIPKAAALLEISPSTIYRKKISWAETGR